MEQRCSTQGAVIQPMRRGRLEMEERWENKKELTTEGGGYYRGEKSWHTFLHLLKTRESSEGLKNAVYVASIG